jgi:hypothetical protein
VHFLVYAFAMVVWEVFSSAGDVPFADIAAPPSLAPKLKTVSKGRGLQTQSFMLAADDAAHLQAMAEAADQAAEATAGNTSSNSVYDDLFVAIVTLKTRPERPSALKEDGVWALLQKCWQPDPEDRPSFAKILDVLKDEFDVRLESGMSSNDESVSYSSEGSGPGRRKRLSFTSFGLTEREGSSSDSSSSSSVAMPTSRMTSFRQSPKTPKKSPSVASVESVGTPGTPGTPMPLEVPVGDSPTSSMESSMSEDDVPPPPPF